MRAAAFLAAVILASPLAALADERPVEWSLPDRGAGCRFDGRFTPGTTRRPTCGDTVYQLYTCSEQLSQMGPVQEVRYLVIGEMQTDTTGVCSPTFVVRQVVRQSTPQPFLPQQP